jgi:adenosylhomocysteine nucleosidase
VDRVCSTPAEKRELARLSGADAVDMESSAVARAAAGIPFLCARAILDEVDYALPIDFSRTLGPSGEPSPWRIFKEVARRPAKLFRTLDLGARAQAALDSLKSALPQLIEAMAVQRPAGG